MDQLISVQADDPETEGGARKGKVNVVVETGGAAQWYAGDLGMDISEDSLQRWVCGTERVSEYSVVSRMELRESCPLSSMADPDTLADFIRWGVENYPAKNTPWSCGTTAEAH